MDLETVTDYKHPDKIFSSMIKNSDENEQLRMGWSLKFHIGSDMNQILGEMLDRYDDIIPKFIYDVIRPLLIKYDKEFEYAINTENKLTTGDEMTILCFSLMEKHYGIGRYDKKP
jgi:hypothetical protein